MMERNYVFQLSAEEADYLDRLAKDDESLSRHLMSQEELHSHPPRIHLSGAEAEDLRDLLTLKLAILGFDEKYLPNKQGRMLENLIDKFYLR
jgi:hypothetical protein